MRLRNVFGSPKKPDQKAGPKHLPPSFKHLPDPCGKRSSSKPLRCFLQVEIRIFNLNQEGSSKETTKILVQQLQTKRMLCTVQPRKNTWNPNNGTWKRIVPLIVKKLGGCHSNHKPARAVCRLLLAQICSCFAAVLRCFWYDNDEL